MASEPTNVNLADFSTLNDLDFFLHTDAFSSTNTSFPQECTTSSASSSKLKEDNSEENLNESNSRSHNGDFDLDFFSSPSKFWNIKKETEDKYTQLQNVKHELNFDSPHYASHSPKSSSNQLKVNLDDIFLKPTTSKVLKNSKKPQFCPQCKIKYSENRPLKYFQMSLEHRILLCSTHGCTYPFDTPGETVQIEETSAEEVLMGKIDIESNNLVIDSNEIQGQLAQLQGLSASFLDLLDSLKNNFRQLECGEYTPHEVDNTQLMHLINEAFEENRYTDAFSVENEENNIFPNIGAVSIKESNSQYESLDEINENNIEEMLRKFI